MRGFVTDTKKVDQWNPALYDQRHSFVNALASGLIDLLKPHRGERILDLGCGTGPLTQQIASTGADVLGIDASPAMIAQARQKFPGIHFEIADALTMDFVDQFDAIFSNAVLHWVKPPEVAARCMYTALKPGGRLVLEMGGLGNVDTILREAINTGIRIGVDLTSMIDINYFPSIGEYSSVLERAGFLVGYATLFDRPTELSDGEAGLGNWIRMFRPGVEAAIPAEARSVFFAELQNRCRDRLYSDGSWRADYVRLRMVASRRRNFPGI
jgi:trans-aconitate methyltransferase